jgi:catechol 2,3-dioxygenase
MRLPDPVYDPPFQITRASHAVLKVADLAVSEVFYTQILGLVVTTREADRLYLRGLEETCHHSLVLEGGAATPAARRVGLRVFRDVDLDRAALFFAARGLPFAFVDVPHQGRTLLTADACGTPLEFCATMPVVERKLTAFTEWLGGCAMRFDHYQLLVPDVQRACDFYAAMGFRLSEYMVDASEMPLGIFIQRKGNPHDIAIMHGAGPRLHHVAYTTPDVHTLIRACDVAGDMGFGDRVERGPGRHGPGHALFVYFRDPDGHRVELFNTHYQTIDIENESVRWDPSNMHRNLPWGLPAQKSWYEEAACFEAAPVREPSRRPEPLTLERYLAQKA